MPFMALRFHEIKEELETGADVIRMAPSLIIPDEDIDEGLSRFARAVESVAGAT